METGVFLRVGKDFVLEVEAGFGSVGFRSVVLLPAWSLCAKNTSVVRAVLTDTNV